jgi:hypothetical protein
MKKRHVRILDEIADLVAIIGIMAALILALIAKLPTSDKGVTFIKDGSFVVQDGGIISFEKLGNNHVLHWYFDPSCKSCRKLHAYTHNDIKKISSVMPIQFHPVNYLNNHQKNGYSLTSAALILSVVKNDKDNALDFMTAVLDENFAPYTDDKPLDEYKNAYHGSDWNVIISDYTMKQMVEENTNKLHDMTFPALIIGNNTYKINLKLKPDNVSYGEYITDKIKEYIK